MKSGEKYDFCIVITTYEREDMLKQLLDDIFKYTKKLIDNPNWAIEMGERLHEHVMKHYDLNVVTKNRAEFYKSIV